MTTPFPADDCYITWTFQHLGAHAVVRASAACKQWRKVGGEVLRLRHASSTGPTEWAAALDLDCDPATDHHQSRQLDPDSMRLMLKPTLHTSHRLPDIAIVLSTNPMNVAALDKLATRFPPHVPILGIRATGLVGPCVAHETSEHFDRRGQLAEVEDEPANCVLLGSLPGVELSWALTYQQAGKRCIVTHGARRHGGAWWSGVAPRADVPKLTYPGPLMHHIQQLEEWAPERGYNGGRFLMLRDSTNSVDPLEALLNGSCGSIPPRLCAGAVVSTLVFKAPGAPARKVRSIALQLSGAVPCSVVAMPGQVDHGDEIDLVSGSAAVEAQLRYGLARKDDADRRLHNPPVGPIATAHSVAPDAPMLTPTVGLLFTCNGRGEQFHDEANAEANAIQRVLPGVPVVGVFSGGEIGPSVGGDGERAQGRGDPEVEDLAYTAVLALFG